eukprot:757291-Hanusia_phi.AAC.2
MFKLARMFQSLDWEVSCHQGVRPVFYNSISPLLLLLSLARNFLLSSNSLTRSANQANATLKTRRRRSVL